MGLNAVDNSKPPSGVTAQPYPKTKSATSEIAVAGDKRVRLQQPAAATSMVGTIGFAPRRRGPLNTVETTAGSIGSPRQKTDDRPGQSRLLQEMTKKRSEDESVAWYLPEAPSVPAFLDIGNSLAFSGTKAAPLPDRAIEAGLMLAVERGWVPPAIEGNEGFLKAAWLEACRLGIPVDGYTPSKDDLDHLKTIGLSVPSRPASPSTGSAPSL